MVYYIIYSLFLFDFYLIIIIGVVNPSDLTITLSDEVTVVENKDYALHHTITGLTSTTYLIGFYDGSGSSDQTGPISAILATITDSVNGETVVHGQVTLGAAVVLDSKIAAFNIASDRVDNSSAIFTFADVTADFSLTTILVAIDSTGLPSFGSAVSFSSGRTLSLVQTYLIMDLDVAVISRPSKVGKSNPNSVKFSILYSDITNDGILTTASGMVNFLFYFFFFLYSLIVIIIIIIFRLLVLLNLSKLHLIF